MLQIDTMMRYVLTILISVSTCLSFISCGFKVPSIIKQEFKYCYDGKNTGIDSLINIHGYYSIGQTLDRSGTDAIYKHIIDTFYLNFMFYQDGTFLYNFGDYDNNIPEYFKNVIEVTNKGKKHWFYRNNKWGRYIVTNDTIKAQWYHMPCSLNDGWYDGEVWFKVINRNELKKIFVPKAINIKEKVDENLIPQVEYFPAKFISVEILPKSNCKLKQEKWFWCNN
ncbi:MAG: hypothetical protein ACKVQV_05970 [Bacteroidia bacterium]